MNRFKSLLALIGLVLASSLFVSCKDTTLSSEWRTPTLTSDNPDSSWQHTSTYAWEDQNILLGLQNDAEKMVILLRARNRATQATIMRSGLTIWFDPAGKKDRGFGIHYPIGQPIRGKRPDTSGMPKEKIPEYGNQPYKMPDTMEIISGKEHKTIPIQNDLGFSVLTINDLGTITFQYSIPLKNAGREYGINAAPGSSISLGFETGVLDGAPENRPMDRPGRGMGPDGGYGGRGGGFDNWNGARDSTQQRPRGRFGIEPVQFWTKVILAVPNGGKN